MGERGLARMRRDAIGFVFQAFHFMDELTAVENVELPGDQEWAAYLRRVLAAMTG